MDPRVKPEDDDVAGPFRHQPPSAIGIGRKVFVILGLDPRIHA
jgi:hypothetical protein